MASSREIGGALVLLLLAGVVTVIVATLVPDSDAPELTLPELKLTEPFGLLDQARKRDQTMLDNLGEPDEAGRTLLSRFREFNMLEHGCLTEDRQTELAAARLAVSEAAAVLVDRRGAAGFRALGRVALKRFEESLQDLLAAGSDSARVMRASELLRPWAGGLVEDGLAAGLLQGKPEGPVRVPRGHEAYLRALYLARWMRFMEPRFPLEAMLDASDRSTLLRWRIAVSRTASLEQRIEAVKDLTGLDRRFRPRLTAGLLFARAGKLERARIELQIECNESRSPRAEQALKWVEQALKDGDVPAPTSKAPIPEMPTPP